VQVRQFVISIVPFVRDKYHEMLAQTINFLFSGSIRARRLRLPRRRNLLNNGANLDDIDAFLEERNLPLDDIGRRMLAERIAVDPPKQGYVTVSNALQWRLQYA